MLSLFLAMAASAPTPAPYKARAQAIVDATVTIIDPELIDFTKNGRLRKDRPMRQVRTSNGVLSYDYY